MHNLRLCGVRKLPKQGGDPLRLPSPEPGSAAAAAATTTTEVEAEDEDDDDDEISEKDHDDDDHEEEAEEEPSTGPTGPTHGRDNRNLFVRRDNQRLRASDVARMKETGATGEQVVAALVENSATFATKTKFSQEKYLAKKHKRHVARFVVLRTTARTVAEVVQMKNPPSTREDRLRRLRWIDSLPQMVTFGNIHASSRSLVLDGVGGSLVCAVVERLVDGPNGGVCMYVNPTRFDAKISPARFLNLSSESLASRVVSVPFGWVPGVCPAGVEPPPFPAPPNATTKARLDENDPVALLGVERARLAAELLLGSGADSLLVASPHDPEEALRALYPLLALGAPFVVHSPTVEPLVRCRTFVYEAGACNVCLWEPWCREMQVLPDRTHPLMMGSVSGGFMLRGFKAAKPAWESAGVKAEAAAAAATTTTTTTTDRAENETTS